MKIQEVIHRLETFAPPSFQENYDNSGLLVGNSDDEVAGVLLCIDSTEAVVDEAIAKKCNLIIAHHPIVFTGLKRITGKNYIERTLIKAIKNDIAIYAAHTNLDNVHQGVNQQIANKIGLKKCRVLQPKKALLQKLVTFCPTNKAEAVREALFGAGAGQIGKYDHCSFNQVGEGTFRGNTSSTPYVGEPGKDHLEKEIRIEVLFNKHQRTALIEALHSAHPYEEVAYDIYPLDMEHPQVGSGLIGELDEVVDAQAFLNSLKAIFHVPMLRYTQIHKKQLKHIAVCGGSGSFLLADAIRAKADLFITADMKYHQFFDAENNVIVADIGHYESEQFTTELFHELLMEKFPTFAIHFSEVNTNPVNYL
jgi:dinuclear metal center YbgI/SA1388 family protein